MNLVKLLILAAVVGGGWHYWNKQQTAAATVAATSANGFVALPSPSGAAPGRVLVVAAENCTAEAARRADDLASELSRHKVQVTRTHNISFQITDPEPGVMPRINAVMNGELPIVFVGHRAKNNPSVAEVLAELRG